MSLFFSARHRRGAPMLRGPPPSESPVAIGRCQVRAICLSVLGMRLCVCSVRVVALRSQAAGLWWHGARSQALGRGRGRCAQGLV